MFCGFGLSGGGALVRRRRGLSRAFGTVRLTWLNRISGAILALSGLALLAAALLAFAGMA